MKKTSANILLVLLLLISSIELDAQITISGVTLPGTLKAGNSNLILNGAGTRVKLFIDIYVAGLSGRKGK